MERIPKDIAAIVPTIVAIDAYVLNWSFSRIVKYWVYTLVKPLDETAPVVAVIEALDCAALVYVVGKGEGLELTTILSNSVTVGHHGPRPKPVNMTLCVSIAVVTKLSL